MLVRSMLIWLLHLIEGVVVRLANLRRTVPRTYLQYPSYDLLKAQRIAVCLSDGEAVLDIGCGNGHVLDELGLFRNLRRTGVDLAPRARPPGVSISSFDGRSLPFPDQSFDVSLFCYVLHHLTRHHAQQLLTEALRVSRRGVILLEDSVPEFDRLYQLRNKLHRLGADLEYRTASPRYESPRSEGMFLTHDGWCKFLRAVPAVASVRVESLAAPCRYRHHTLIEVTKQPTAWPLPRST
jgi:SAM-dependent methyltransferase